jgi:hypothetical protein
MAWLPPTSYANDEMADNQEGRDESKDSEGKSGHEPPPGTGADELPERWSVQRKAELVLRLLRGESPETVSRESCARGSLGRRQRRRPADYVMPRAQPQPVPGWTPFMSLTLCAGSTRVVLGNRGGLAYHLGDDDNAR